MMNKKEFEEFKEECYNNCISIYNIDTNGISPEDLVNEIINNCIDNIFNILEKYNNKLQEKKDEK